MSLLATTTGLFVSENCENPLPLTNPPSQCLVTLATGVHHLQLRLSKTKSFNE
jgi:hypothetical protein